MPKPLHKYTTIIMTNHSSCDNIFENCLLNTCDNLTNFIDYVFFGTTTQIPTHTHNHHNRTNTFSQSTTKPIIKSTKLNNQNKIIPITTTKTNLANPENEYLERKVRFKIPKNKPQFQYNKTTDEYVIV